jgi:hypothetical protein
MSLVPERHAPFVAAALILGAMVAGWLLMPRIMLMVSGGGPLAGVAVALLFMLAFFAVLWLRGRHQRRFHKD